MYLIITAHYRNIDLHTHTYTHTHTHTLTCTCMYVPETLMEESTSLTMSCLVDPELHGVPVAKASGQVTVKVKLKQNEAAVGPKLDVDGFLGSLHLLFSPQQLSMLLEMTSGILNEGTCTCKTVYSLPFCLSLLR